MKDVFHISNCPVCKADQFQLVFTTQDFLVSKEAFSILECESCGFRFTQDVPSVENIAPYYDHVGYVEHSDNQEGLVNTLYHWGRQLMLRQKSKLIRRSAKGTRLLDVGSASGYFLNHMKGEGYEVSGVEISPKARELCKSIFNIDTFPPEWMSSTDRSFDVITLWHVFEHVYTYDEYFRSFGAMLESEGRLIIAMPNFKSLDAKYYGRFWNAYDVPRHIWHFDHDSFSRFAQDRGFTVESIKLLPLDPFYNSMVSAEYRYRLRFLPWTLVVATLSYLWSLLSTKKASSIVYILKKTN